MDAIRLEREHAAVKGCLLDDCVPDWQKGMRVPIVSDALITSAIEQAQLALAAKRLKMNAEAALEVAQQNMKRIANLSPGIGGTLDVSR
jgi:hypothetical protein